jgi:hypothetical protein
MRPLWLLASLLCVTLLALPARAASVAQDDASDTAYDDGWQVNDAGGTGWDGGWALSGTGSFAAVTSTANGDGDDDADGDIDTAGRAWCIETTGTNNAAALRFLDGVLAVGQTIAAEIDHDPLTSGAVRIVLEGTEQRFRLQWNGTNYIATDGDLGLLDLGSPPTDEGVRLELTLTSPGTYALVLTSLAGGPPTQASGDLEGAGAITSLHYQILGDGAPRQACLNRIAVPEPGAGAAGWAACGVLAALARVRTRR